MKRYREKHPELPPRMHFKGGRYYLVTYTDGKRKWLKLSRNFSKALNQYHQLQAGHDDSGRRFIDLYLRYRRHDFYLDLSENTQKRYEYAFANIVPVFRDMEVSAIRPMDIWQYLELRRTHKDAANTEHGILKRLFDLSMMMGWRDDNPVAAIPYHKTKKRERILTPAEFSAVYLAANAPVRLAMDLGYMMGLRIGDILSMTWGQVDEGGIYVHQSKNSVKGYYQMSNDLRAALSAAKGLHGRTVLPVPELHVVHNRKQQEYSYYGFRSMFRRAVMKSGVKDVRFHDIRRTAITAAAVEGRQPQSFSLHKSARQAQDYVIQIPNVVPLKRG